jgi:membrane-associated phospholipid phosphatase
VKTGVSSLLLALLLGAGWTRADSIESTGNVLAYAMPATVAGLTLIHEDWEGTWRFTGAMAVQGLTVLALKNAVYETRPSGQGHESFPSGHASSAFCSAEFLRIRYGWSYGAPAYALAAFTAYSRVESDQHHWRDVGAGAAIGILSCWLFTYHFQEWDVAPLIDGKAVGLTLARAW